MPQSADGPAQMRQAATVILLRDGARGLEVFMVVRHHKIDFASGALVFPGGKVDAADRDPAWADLVQADDRDPVPAAEFRIAAVRETFEEAGMLIACKPGSGDLIDRGLALALADAHRGDVHAGRTPFAKVVRDAGIVLAADRMIHFAHWITPVHMPKRFDTHFFLVSAPMDQLGAHDGHESVDSVWIMPQQALDEADNGERTLVTPTRLNLQKLAGYRTVAAAVTAAQAEPVVTVLPQVNFDDRGRTLTIPAAAGYGVSEIFVPKQ